MLFPDNPTLDNKTRQTDTGPKQKKKKKNNAYMYAYAV